MLHSAAIFFRNTLDPLALSKEEKREREQSDGNRSGGRESSDSSGISSFVSTSDLVIPLNPFEDAHVHLDGPTIAATIAATTAPGGITSPVGQPEQRQPQPPEQQANPSTGISGDTAFSRGKLYRCAGLYVHIYM